jgi:predicted PurR-regulated permease PerM
MEQSNSAPPALGRGAHALLVVACAVVIIAAAKAGASLLAPLALALFLAFLSFPLVFGLQAYGWPSWLATLTTLAANLAIVGLLVFLAFVSVGDFEERLPLYKEKSQILYNQSLEWIHAQGWVAREKLELPQVSPSAVFDLTRKGVSRLLSVLSNGALVLLIMIFALLEAASFPGKLRLIFGHTEANADRFHHIVREIISYLWIKTVVSVATGLFVGIGAWIIGVDFPILWGLLTFALNYIPTIGSILAAIPSVLLALVQLGWVHAASFLGVIIVANILFGNIVEPLLMGKRLGLSTLVVTLALVFWGWLWGPVGMLLSVPLTMVLKIVVQNIPDLAWIHIVLSDWKEPTPPPPPPPPPAEEVPSPNESPASPSPAE